MDENWAERQKAAAEKLTSEIRVFLGLSRQTEAAVNPTAAAGHASLLWEALLSPCVCVCRSCSHGRKIKKDNIHFVNIHSTVLLTSVPSASDPLRLKRSRRLQPFEGFHLYFWMKTSFLVALLTFCPLQPNNCNSWMKAAAHVAWKCWSGWSTMLAPNERSQRLPLVYVQVTSMILSFSPLHHHEMHICNFACILRLNLIQYFFFWPNTCKSICKLSLDLSELTSWSITSSSPEVWFEFKSQHWSV